MEQLKENVIEWITGDSEIAVTVSQPKYVNRIKRLAESHGDLVHILAVNSDGSIFAHLPLTALKLNIISPKEMGEEERRALAERLANGRKERLNGMDTDNN